MVLISLESIVPPPSPSNTLNTQFNLSSGELSEVGRVDQVLVLSVHPPEAGGVDRQHVLLEIHVPAVVFVKHS